MSKRSIFLVAIILILTVTFAYGYFPNSDLEGTIKVSGAWALYPMMVEWAEEFQKIHPKVRIDLSAGGAGKGMADVLGGLVDIGMVSREIYPEEIQRGAIGVAVCKDAVVPTVNKDNPVMNDLLTKGIKRQTLMDIWVNGNVTTWGEVVGRPEVTDKINVFTRSDACGAAETWAKYLGCRQEGLLGVGVYGDPGLAEAVKNDPLGIGFNNLNYAYDNSTGKPVEGLRVAPIDLNANGQVDENENFYSTKAQLVEAIATGAYPSPPARDLYVVAKGEFKGLTKEFVKWILTEGQQYVSQTGYIQLSTEKLAEELKKLG
ncbi:MAG: substrate-binding domain-containing protein [Candidatus Bathyarchaeia archaeon]